MGLHPTGRGGTDSTSSPFPSEYHPKDAPKVGGHLPLAHHLLNCLPYTLGDVQSRTTGDGGKNIDYRKTAFLIRPHCSFLLPLSLFLGNVGD